LKVTLANFLGLYRRFFFISPRMKEYFHYSQKEAQKRLDSSAISIYLRKGGFIF